MKNRPTKGTRSTAALALGLLLVLGCAKRGPRTAEGPPAKDEAPGGAAPGVAEEAAVKEVTAAAPAAPVVDTRDPMVRLAELTAAEIAALNAKITGQIAETNRRHKKRLEALCYALRTASLREPDISANTTARNVERAVLMGDAGPENIVGYRHAFVRTTTQEALDRIVAELRAYPKKTIRALEGRRPVSIARERWNELVDELNARFKTANALLEGGQVGSSEIKWWQPELFKDRILAAIESPEANDGERAGKAEEIKRELNDSRGKFETFAERAKRVANFGKEARDVLPQIDRKASALEDLKEEAKEEPKGVDRAALLFYHKEFLSQLPTGRFDFDAVNAMGLAVRKAKAEAPGMWSLKAVAEPYAAWQTVNYLRLMERFADRLGNARKARSLALKGERVDWQEAALAVSREEAQGLLTLLTESAIRPGSIKEIKNFVPLLEDILGEHDVAALPEGSLVPVNASIATRELGLKGDARRYHMELIGRANGNQEIGEIVSMKATVDQSLKEKPELWPDVPSSVLVRDPRGRRTTVSARERLVRFYAGLWRSQWQAYAGARVKDLSFLVVLREIRGDDESAAARWEKAAKELDPGLVQGTIGLLSSGMWVENSAFWEDAAWMQESVKSEAGALARENPYELTRQLKLASDARAYHIALIRRFNGNSDMASVAAMKKTIEREKKTHPDYWEKAARAWEAPASKYAALQTDQFVAYCRKHLGDRLKKASEQHMYSRRRREEWAKVCSAFEKAEVEAILGFLREGVLDQRTFENQLSKRFGMGRMGLGGKTSFWEDVAEAIGLPTGN